jgi:hypothetical protein
MDPNKALEEIIELADDILHTGGTKVLAEELASKVIGLDNWLSKGGFAPTRWGGKIKQGPREGREG